MTAPEKAAVKIILALLLSCVSTAVHAQPYFNASGIGRSSCGQYLSAFHDRPPGKIRTITHPEGDLLMRPRAIPIGSRAFSRRRIGGERVPARGTASGADYAIMDVWMERRCE